MIEQASETASAVRLLPHAASGVGTLWQEELRQVVTAVCGRVSPLWDIKSFIAVNPLRGFEDRSFRDAAQAAGAYFHAEAVMPLAFFREAYRAGRITHADVEAVVRDYADASLGDERHLVEQVLQATEGSSPVGDHRVLTLTERLDQAHGTADEQLVRRELCKWCAAYFDQGEAAWPMPGRDQRFFVAWRHLAVTDRTMRLRGIAAFNDLVAQLPEDPFDAICILLARLDIPSFDRTDYLTRHLTRLPGWSGFIKYRSAHDVRHHADGTTLVDLLAVSLTYEAAVATRHRRMPHGTSQRVTWEPRALDALEVRLLWQSAYERAYRRGLLAQIAPGEASRNTTRPEAQAVFCIDVRSEIIRRHLERQGVPGQYQTLGFAGFFGFAVAHRSLDGVKTARCPALLRPSFTVEDRPVGDGAVIRRGVGVALGSALKRLKSTAVSCYFFVESLGLLYGAAALARTLWPKAAAAGRDLAARLLSGQGPTRPAVEACCPDHEPAHGIPLSDQAGIALAALKAMGLRDNFGRVVLLCGHGSTTENNPYAAALNCGACGGHEGGANALIAAAAFNNPEVRRRLALDGLVIPADTWFVAGRHDTATDEVVILDEDQVPPSHRAAVADLKQALGRAGNAARAERARRLPDGTPGLRQPDARQRSRDWSEVRPEWGLAGNAAFVVGPRSLTASADLGGRVFLHSYDHAGDPHGAALEAILTAPVVVAEWINTQYYFSTVDNAHFGSGDKVIHNVTGRLGVMQGNQGDLLVGLPLQSLHDGRRLVHEPMRLTVVVHAPRERVAGIIEKRQEIRRLVDNEWLTLVVLEPEGGYYRYLPGGDWRPEKGSADEAAG